MTAYILRRDLLPAAYSYDTILAMDTEQLCEEMNRQLDVEDDQFIAVYSVSDLEDLINLDKGAFNPSEYYIRIFE